MTVHERMKMILLSQREQAWWLVGWMASAHLILALPLPADLTNVFHLFQFNRYNKNILHILQLCQVNYLTGE